MKKVNVKKKVIIELTKAQKNQVAGGGSLKPTMRPRPTTRTE